MPAGIRKKLVETRTFRFGGGNRVCVIEEKTKTWDKVIVDRQSDLFEWVGLLKKAHERRIMILDFADNHYAGNGPATVELFRNLWSAEALPKVLAPRQMGRQFRSSTRK
jgi:hypothetical protein